MTPAPSPDSPCTQCSTLRRREFIGIASTLALASGLSSCGDGILDAPEARLSVLPDPMLVEFEDYPSLQTVGGHAVVTPQGFAPMWVEAIGVRQYRALALVCPHRGTVVDSSASGFACPNHGARFDDAGRWIGGQATVDLAAVRVSLVGDSALRVGGLVPPPGPPILNLSQRTMSFSATVGGGVPASQSVLVTSTGVDVLPGLNIALSYSGQTTGWLAASLSALASPATLTLSVARGTLAAGSYAAEVRVSSPNASNAAEVVSVTLVVLDTSSPPAIQLGVSAVTLESAVGTSPASQSVPVVNSGSGTVGALAVVATYGAGASGWLSTSSLSSTSTPATLTVRALTGALAVGTYTASLTVSGAGVASRVLAVTLHVAANGLAVTLAAWPALANVGGVAGSVGTLNFSAVAVVRTGANSFSAFSLSCPHAGTTVQVQNGQSFRCPNHGALWNAAGSLLPNSPQRTSSLDRLTVTYAPGATVLYVS